MHPVFPPDHGAELALERAIEVPHGRARPVWEVWIAAEVSLDDTRLGRFAAWRPVRRASEAALVRAARAAPSAPSRSCSRGTGRPRTAPPADRPRRAAAEDIAQEAFLAALRRARRLRPPPAARARGCTGSSSTARSTSRGRAPLRRRSRVEARARGRRRAGRRHRLDDELARGARAARRPSSARSSSCGTCSSYTPGEIAELLELPRGTVNSRLRRGLDALGERLER